MFSENNRYLDIFNDEKDPHCIPGSNVQMLSADSLSCVDPYISIEEPSWDPDIIIIIKKQVFSLLSMGLWGQGQLIVKGSSNRMLPRFQEPILGYVLNYSLKHSIQGIFYRPLPLISILLYFCAQFS